MNKNFIKVTLLFLLTMCLAFQTQAAPGDLDPTFGTGGTVVTGTPILPSYPRDVAIQNDGKIVVLGRKFNSSASRIGFIVVRYNPNGTLDTTFDGDGAVTTVVSRNLFSAESILVQNDGKILVAGRLDQTGALAHFTYNWVFVRYNSNGSLDTTFNGSGILETTIASPNGGRLEILPLGNGKFYAVGTCRYDYTIQTSSGTVAAVCVGKYNSDGSTDTSFNNNDTAIAPYAYQLTPTLIAYRSARADSAILQSDGKIVIVSHIVFTTSQRTAVTRLSSNGVPDGSFGTQPEGNSGWNYVKIRNSGIPLEIANDLVLQPDGKIIAVGEAISTITNPNNGVFFALRFDPNGILDNSFDSDGIVLTDIRNDSDEPFSVVLQPDGKIILLGSTKRYNPLEIDSAFVRYNPDGSLDNSFGTNGIAIRDLGTFTVGARAAAFQSDGKLIVVGDAFTHTAFTVARILTDSTSIQNRTKYDFDGDGKADISVFRPSNGAWYLNQSQNGFTGVQFGVSTDKIVPADYDGDGKTDVAVYRSGVWYLNRSQLGFTGFAFGDANDIPQPADFDGDGKTELAVFRPSNGTWYVFNLANNQFNAVQFGASTDKPVVADYDGDGKADYAVYRSGVWYIQRSQLGFTGVAFGDAQDKPVPADYDGDNKADVAVFRPSNGVWYLQRSRDGFIGIQFGISTDLPTPADYDGDGKADVAVFRAGTWYLQRSTAGFTGVAFGAATDKPVQNAFVP